MPHQPPNSPLGAFLAALRQEKIDCILIGNMAAVQQGAPVVTLDYDFWVDLPERQYIRIASLVQSLNGSLLAPTLYELSDGTQVNTIFDPTGLRSFKTEYKKSARGRLGGQGVRILPLKQVIASKQAVGRDKDLAVLPILKRTLRLRAKLVGKRPKRVRGR